MNDFRVNTAKNYKNECFNSKIKQAKQSQITMWENNQKFMVKVKDVCKSELIRLKNSINFPHKISTFNIIQI